MYQIVNTAGRSPSGNWVPATGHCSPTTGFYPPPYAFCETVKL
jgi:hypothetical protein